MDGGGRYLDYQPVFVARSGALVMEVQDGREAHSAHQTVEALDLSAASSSADAGERRGPLRVRGLEVLAVEAVALEQGYVVLPGGLEARGVTARPDREVAALELRPGDLPVAVAEA